ncbi:hypothetical protein V6260_01690 [Pseudoalteromonas aliena]|uniref:hypothetical protein n=1 Tax=Pseudoalteromonas aliena TaxID=247523 RepID=UPI00311F4299
MTSKVTGISYFPDAFSQQRSVTGMRKVDDQNSFLKLNYIFYTSFLCVLYLLIL